MMNNGPPGSNPPGFRAGHVRPLPTRPRRVRHGCKLSVKPDRLGSSAIGRLWVDWVRQSARDEAALEEGTAYAKSGQVIEFSVAAGRIVARIQGRRGKAYEWKLEVARFEPADCDRLIEAVAREARFAAGLDARELAEALPDVSSGLGLSLVPIDESDQATVSCTCAQFATDEEKALGGWCKHGIAVGLLFAEAMDADPAQAWRLRGVDTLELSDRVRLKRSIESGAGPMSAHQGEVALRAGEAGAPLESTLDSFHDLPSAIAGFETRLVEPAVPHVLLRRLGPSPMGQNARFPILGLLATCYELITAHVLAEQIDAGESDDVEDTDE